MNSTFAPCFSFLSLGFLGLAVACGSTDEESEGAAGATGFGGMAMSGGASAIDGSGGTTSGVGGSFAAGGIVGVGGAMAAPRTT